MSDLLRVIGGQVIWPYSLGQLKADEPSYSFSVDPTDQEYAYFNVFRKTPTEAPVYDPATHRVAEVQPVEADGTWQQAWELVELTPEEQAEHYRQTHPPQWIAFGQAVQSLAEINTMLAAALQAAPALAMALPVGLGKAADGDALVFLAAWQAGRTGGLISAALVVQIQQLATAHDLPAEFIAGLGDQPWQRPENPQRGYEWTAPDGSRWRWDQPRDAQGQYLADDTATPESESAPRWVPVGGEA